MQPTNNSIQNTFYFQSCKHPYRVILRKLLPVLFSGSLLWFACISSAAAQVARLDSGVLRCKTEAQTGYYGGCLSQGNTVAITDFAFSNRVDILDRYPDHDVKLTHHWVRPDGTSGGTSNMTYRTGGLCWPLGLWGPCVKGLTGYQTYEQLYSPPAVGQWSLEFLIDDVLVETLPFEVKPHTLTSVGPTYTVAQVSTAVPLTAILKDYYDQAGVSLVEIVFNITRSVGGSRGDRLVYTHSGLPSTAGDDAITIRSNSDGSAVVNFETGNREGLYIIEATSWAAPDTMLTYTIDVVGGYECADGIDNDGNGKIDYPDDPGCESDTDNTETSPQCADGFDNDGDGLIDYPQDAGCISAASDTEYAPQCSDQIDNDGDGKIDYPEDTGCISPTDDDEFVPQCSDGIDNDGDGAIDSSDSGCTSSTDDSEFVSQCSDGIDNDGDGQTDLNDLGCTSSTDNSEFGDGNEGAPDQPQACVGNPINVTTGNKFQFDTDYKGNTPVPLTFTRTYNSMSDSFADFGGSILGPHWQMGYEQRIIKDPNAKGGSRGKYVVAVRPDGKRILFEKSGGKWAANASVTETISKPPKGDKGWLYTTDDDSVEYYNEEGYLLSVTDRSGNTRTLEYDANGRLARLASVSGETLDFAYDSNGLLVSMTDRAGRVWHYHYDQLNRLITVSKPDGSSRGYYYENPDFPYALTGIDDERGVRYATFFYDAEGRAVSTFHGDSIDRVDIVYQDDGGRSVADALGRSSAYRTIVQNGIGKVAGVDGPGCSSCGVGDSSFEFDTVTNNLLRKTSKGVVTEYGSYDANGNPGYIIEYAGTPEAQRIDYVYDPRFSGKPTTISTDSVYPGAKRVESYTYDDFGRTLSHTINGFSPDGNALSRTILTEYSAPYGQVSLRDGPRTDVVDVTLYEYYGADVVGYNSGRLRRVVGPEGVILRDNIQYSATGRILSEDRQNGLLVTNQYDLGSDRLLSRIETADGQSLTTSWTYLATGEIGSLTVEDTNGASTTIHYLYDEARRKIGIIDGQGNRIDYTLDAKGNTLEEKVFDPTGTLRKAISRTYDIYDQDDVIVQANERSDYDYAPDGTLIRSVNGKGVVTQNSYDARKRLIHTVQDVNGESVSMTYSYDAQGNIVAVTDPNGNTTLYSYDDFGNRLNTSSPDTGITSYHYDVAGNRIESSDAKGQRFQYQYDASGRQLLADAPGTEHDIRTTYDNCVNGSGRVCSLDRGNVQVAYGYTGFGKIASLSQRVGTIEASIEYGYDTQGRVESIRYPSGALLTYHYDTAGNVSGLSLSHTGTHTTLVSGAQYAPFGPMESAQLGNGRSQQYGYDSAYRLTNITDGPYQASISYDAVGNITVLSASSGHNNYQYDTIGRLIEAIGTYGTKAYNYDANGNRLSLTDNGTNSTYGYDAGSNRLSSIDSDTLTMDANGNTLKQSGYSFSYTPDNRLAELVGNAAYQYNALGQRIAKHLSSGSTTYFLFSSNGQVMAEMNATGSVTREYIYFNGHPIALLQPVENKLYYVHSDHLGTAQAISNEYAATVWSAKYDPFGNAALNEDVDGDGAVFTYNLRFPGQYFDGETGLHYNYFRDYDPSSGRYVESDPIGLEGGLNTYAYVGGDPISYIDPLGLDRICGPGRNYVGNNPDGSANCVDNHKPNESACFDVRCKTEMPASNSQCYDSCFAREMGDCLIPSRVPDSSKGAVKGAASDAAICFASTVVKCSKECNEEICKNNNGGENCGCE